MSSSAGAGAPPRGRYDTVVRGGRVVLDGHGVVDVDLGIDGERISAIAASLPGGSGETDKGWPVMTMLRGQVIVRELEPQGPLTIGRFIPRSASERPLRTVRHASG